MSFFIQKGNVFAVPILHYTMEFAMQVRQVFNQIKPDCIAVELPETHQFLFLHASSRLPDISVVAIEKDNPHYYLCEPCDPSFEALRSAIENKLPAFCIDLEVENYPLLKDALPDSYSAMHIGFKTYYEEFCKTLPHLHRTPHDEMRELYMARRLKELSFSYERILFVSGFVHVASVLEKMDLNQFPPLENKQKPQARLVTLTEESCRDCLLEYGWISRAYEEWRESNVEGYLDRQKLLLFLFKASGERYKENTGNPFLGYHLRNTMKFVRNYAHIHGKLMPNLFEVLSAARGCVDHNYAYETWFLATFYPLRKNVDNLPELNLTIDDIWGSSKLMKFHLKQKSRKAFNFKQRKKDSSQVKFRPPSPFSICSYPPEDLVIENFGEFLKKKGTNLLSEEGSRTLPFSTSLEDGIDTKETIRHFHEGKLYVKKHGRPFGSASAVVVIFNEDKYEEEHTEKYPWKTTWIGEHTQESDMAFYATHPANKIVGPGISRCEYGGFMMTSPPRRLSDVWGDLDYSECLSKAEVLLMAAIDYSVKPLIVYVAEKPPRSKIKSFAARFGKKVVYVPLGGLSPITLNKIRSFHVLDGHDKREIAGDYIF